PSVQPSLPRPSRNAAMRACPSGSRSARFINTPIRRIRSGCSARAARGKDDLGFEPDQLLGQGWQPLCITISVTVDDIEVAALDATKLSHPLQKGGDKAYGGPASALTQPGNEWPLLRPCCERPRNRAAEERDECAPPNHSITSSARASSVGAMLIPSAFAVVRLITRSNLVGCSTGMSAGFAPRKILSTNSPARRNRSV